MNNEIRFDEFVWVAARTSLMRWDWVVNAVGAARGGGGGVGGGICD